MPWAPELFSAPILARLEARNQSPLVDVPFWDGLMTGELDALVGSFAGQPELHHPTRGRIRGRRAFEAWVTDLNTWLKDSPGTIEEVDGMSSRRDGFSEAILHLNGDAQRVDLPVATVADKRFDRRINELRMYYSSWALTGRHANRPPVLQSDAELPESDVVAAYQHALAEGDVMRSSRPSSPRATRASRRAPDTCIEAEMPCARSTSCCSPMMAAYRWSTAR